MYINFEWKESRRKREKRIAEAKLEYEALMTRITSNQKMYVSVLDIMSEFAYSPSECVYLLYNMPNVKQLDTFKGWNSKGFRVNKGEKGLTLLDCNNGEEVYFDVSQTNAPTPTPQQKESRLQKEKVRALLSNNIRLLTATKEKFTQGQPAYFDSKYNSVILDRNTTLEDLFPSLAKEMSHAFIFRQIKDEYNRLQFERLAEAIRYVICRKNDVDCYLPVIPSGYTAEQLKRYLELVRLISDEIQDNMEYYYKNGKNQFEKPEPLKRAVKNEETKKDEGDKSTWNFFDGCDNVYDLKKRYKTLLKQYQSQNVGDLSKAEKMKYETIIRYINIEYEDLLGNLKK